MARSAREQDGDSDLEVLINGDMLSGGAYAKCLLNELSWQCAGVGKAANENWSKIDTKWTHFVRSRERDTKSKDQHMTFIGCATF